jgi:4-hydroxy-4-methyl-2-oxoglutarate aldolase
MIDYQACARLGVATIYEASGKEGLIDIALHQLVPHSRVAGPARTVACSQDDNLMVHAAIERIQRGDIVVITMPEPRAVAVVGDLLLTQMIAAGAAGVLVDAAVRDAEDLSSMAAPVWARWIRVRGAKKAIPGALDVPVTVGGTVISPGDLVVLDADGACAIRSERVEEVLVAARARIETESRNRERYARGEHSYDINDLRKLVEGSRA